MAGWFNGVTQQALTEGAYFGLALTFMAIQAVGTAIGVSVYAAWLNSRVTKIQQEVQRSARAEITEVKNEATKQVQLAQQAAKEAEERSRIRVDLMLELMTGHGRIPAGTSEHQLLEVLMSKFNLAEMKMLANDAGIDWDSFSGDTVPSRALEMLKYAKRTGKLSALEVAASRARGVQ